ncbi:unnamed protein product [Periconia digitata]|uniref:Prolyl 4-hydroxylase alpha subunit domain-containing protein n=1 Tax=Periconia digitata TaxID=1303443 RepID=A0A9W4U779_9PLEO|nr:unnamed protein product [Periconia digitata]
MASLNKKQDGPALGAKAKRRPAVSSLEYVGLVAFFVLPFFLQAIWSGQIQQWISPLLRTKISAPSQNATEDIDPSSPSLLEACHTHTYNTEIVSLDPLLIYINNFTSSAEAEALIKLGAPEFVDSYIARSNGANQKVSGRTSQSAPLDDDHPLVACILARARRFLGSMLLPSEPFSLPQLVRYHASQRYDLHTDFWPTHQLMKDGSGRRYNRPASFFVFLRANCTGGETWFPNVDVLDGDGDRSESVEGLFGGKIGKATERGKEKGVVFMPIVGNALFWVNIDGKGKGDRRMLHSGLPVGEGEKIGMNLWPRKFY